MENRPSGKSQESSGSDEQFTSVVDQIKAIAYRNARAELDTEDQLMMFLQSWWSRTYSRPLKDPILLSYTLEELLYEFYDRIERKAAEEERLEHEADTIEMAKEQADLDWAEQEEMKELEALKSKAAGHEAAKPDPTKDPANIKWMEEQIAAAKKIHGDTFGEDIEDNFEGS